MGAFILDNILISDKADFKTEYYRGYRAFHKDKYVNIRKIYNHKYAYG